MVVSLRKFQEKDIPLKIKWINDVENNKYLHYDLPLREDKTLLWFKALRERKDRIDYTILYNREPVGLIGLLNIDFQNRKAEYYICIGEKKFKGRGIAKKATDLLIRRSYNTFYLNRIYLYTEVGNIQAQKLFKRVGFIKEGLLKNDLYYNGKKIERYVYGLDVEKYISGNVKVELKKIIKTPIQGLNENLNKNNYYIKRDDLIPISFGGNKARKAIYFFDDFDKKKCDCVVTYGSSGSNHCRVIANISASKKIPCYIISSTEKEKYSFNDRMIEMFGAHLTKCSLSEVSSTINSKLGSLKKDGFNPYFIKGGGHGNIGTYTYVLAYEEILKYEEENNIFFDYIFLASGTGTTQAGLICGQHNNKNKRKIIGISIARENPYGRKVIFDSIKSYLNAFVHSDKLIYEVNFIDDYILGGYGCYNEEILKTIKKILTFDGIPMDTTYTGKAYWGMKQYIIKNQIKGKNILFLHTGGLPLFFDNFGKLYNGFKI